MTKSKLKQIIKDLRLGKIKRTDSRTSLIHLVAPIHHKILSNEYFGLKPLRRRMEELVSRHHCSAQLISKLGPKLHAYITRSYPQLNNIQTPALLQEKTSFIESLHANALLSTIQRGKCPQVRLDLNQVQ